MANCAILIVNWNSWEFLFKCLTALSQQTYQDFQIFVADNASDAPPPKWIYSIRSDLIFVQNKHNYGFAEANNVLIERVKHSEWTILLNPDAIPEKDWIENLVKTSEKFPEIACFGSRLLMDENPSRLDGDGDIYHISGLAWRKGHAQMVRFYNNVPREIFSACAAAAMYRTKIIKRAGGFDKDFFCYIEDVDLGFRLRLNGCKTLLVPDAIVYHKGSATSGGQHSDFAVYHGHRNMVWTYVKNMPGILFWLFLPYHFIINIFSLFWFAVHGQGKVILRAKKDALMGLKPMWRKRVKIQSNRKASLLDILKMLDRHPIPKLDRFLSLFKPCR